MNEGIEPGCYIDGHWGQYGPDRLIGLAVELGWVADNELDQILAHVAAERVANMGPKMGEFDQHDWITHQHRNHDGDYHYDILEQVHELARGIEDDLNNDLMPEGFRCGWSDGEFYIMPDTWWEEET